MSLIVLVLSWNCNFFFTWIFNYTKRTLLNLKLILSILINLDLHHILRWTLSLPFYWSCSSFDWCWLTWSFSWSKLISRRWIKWWRPWRCLMITVIILLLALISIFWSFSNFLNLEFLFIYAFIKDICDHMFENNSMNLICCRINLSLYKWIFLFNCLLSRHVLMRRLFLLSTSTLFRFR